MSNGGDFSVMINSNDKKRLKQYFRFKRKMSRYPYYILAYCIAEILNTTGVYSRVVIDTEYIGHDLTIKHEVERILIFKGDHNINQRNIQFGFVDKRSNSHKLALSIGRGLSKPQKIIMYDDVIRCI